MGDYRKGVCKTIARNRQAIAREAHMWMTSYISTAPRSATAIFWQLEAAYHAYHARKYLLELLGSEPE